MRASQAKSSEIEIHRTIDLTEETPRMTMAVRRTQAHDAWRSSRRRRFAHGSIDSVADATIATGGLLLANVSLHLNFGLPGGIPGIALGVALIVVGAAIALARRGRRSGGKDPATAARQVVIALDEPTQNVIELQTQQHEHAA